MRLYELRTYTLTSAEALAFYRDVIYPRHLTSAPLFGIQPHGFWTSLEEDDHRLFVLASMDEGADPRQIEEAYMQSPQFLSDVEGLDLSTMLDISVVYLTPTESSPLQ
jgi:NIPSNAP